MPDKSAIAEILLWFTPAWVTPSILRLSAIAEILLWFTPLRATRSVAPLSAIAEILLWFTPAGDYGRAVVYLQ